ncbi:hypothetical protein BDW42DRAFT_32510 [Aspergillus taichungensis]|uniref:Uncharacterized protein n=1 Tax=Aspergillus taichungensis TaxID=482145 RepID=A0A2J5HFU3_9EURO|nr:hypothetical protein BDW42DRAFT_32510 [Aspergillus taichungensis]
MGRLYQRGTATKVGEGVAGRNVIHGELGDREELNCYQRGIFRASRSREETFPNYTRCHARGWKAYAMQTSSFRDREVTRRVIELAEPLLVSVDLPILGNRLSDTRNRFSSPTPQTCSSPSWRSQSTNQV